MKSYLLPLPLLSLLLDHFASEIINFLASLLFNTGVKAFAMFFFLRNWKFLSGTIEFYIYKIGINKWPHGPPPTLDSIFLGHHDLHLYQPRIRVAGQPIKL